MNKPILLFLSIILVFLFTTQYVFSKDYYVSPTGSGSSFTISTPGTVANALTLAAPGDFIRLLPGTYTQIAVTKSGSPEKPITIISESGTPANYAQIDMGAVHDAPINSGPKGYEGIVIANQSWIVIENIKFRNCWQNIIQLTNSNYITVRGCDFRGAHAAVGSTGINTHHLLMENNFWEQDKRIWTTWSWQDTHADYYGYNGSFYASNDCNGANVFRNNEIQYVYNAFQMWASNGPNIHANMEIYGNRISHTVDNTFEPEGHAFNQHFYHNVVNQTAHYVFSIIADPGTSSGVGNNDDNGPIYIYGNVGYYDFTDVPGGGSTWEPTMQLVKYFEWMNPATPLYFFHNTFYYGGFQNKFVNDHSIVHNNNIGGIQGWLRHD